ncbi:MAG: diguanylate cyclase [Actinomycetota bacterium]|nr:diguanylate cyclase [Actinomycetota bacterium]
MSDQTQPHDDELIEDYPGSLSDTRRILDGAHEAFISMDAGGFITEWNREAERTFGFSRAEVMGRELAVTIIPEQYRPAHWEAIQRFLSSGETSIMGRRLELTALHREGHQFPVEMTVSSISYGKPGAERVMFSAFLHDISARQLTQQVLTAMQSVTHAMARAHTPSQALDALLATLGRDMHWHVASYWERSADGKLRCAAFWHSPDAPVKEFQAQSGTLALSEGEGFPGHTVQRGEPVWVQDFTRESEYLRREAAAQAGLQAAIGVPVLRAGQIVGVLEFLTTELRVRDSSITEALATVGEQVGELLGILEDRQALLTRLERLALTDQLTGLPNRRAWEQGLGRELARAARDQHPVCVAVIDLDNFKRYNDEHGHQVGDRLLAESAHAWVARLRAGDLLTRYGGEEFAAVIPTSPIEAAVAVVERLRQATPAGQTCSAGVACWNGGESAPELFARADAALYEAKQCGRDRTVAAV